MAGNRFDCLLTGTAFGQFCDAVMPEIMKPQTLQILPLRLAWTMPFSSFPS
jgi:hypothetical protein